MKKVLLILTAIFVILTLVSVGYLIYTKGSANTLFSTISAILALVCYQMYRALKFKDKDENK